MKILFVCTGNTCRSPMAEGMFRQMMTEKGLEEKVLCQSAGLVAADGAPVSDHAVTVCQELEVYRQCRDKLRGELAAFFENCVQRLLVFETQGP